jgi:hypothetical protein
VEAHRVPRGRTPAIAGMRFPGIQDRQQALTHTEDRADPVAALPRNRGAHPHPPRAQRVALLPAGGLARPIRPGAARAPLGPHRHSGPACGSTRTRTPALRSIVRTSDDFSILPHSCDIKCRDAVRWTQHLDDDFGHGTSRKKAFSRAARWARSAWAERLNSASRRLVSSVMPASTAVLLAFRRKTASPQGIFR